MTLLYILLAVELLGIVAMLPLATAHAASEGDLAEENPYAQNAFVMTLVVVMSAIWPFFVGVWIVENFPDTWKLRRG